MERLEQSTRLRLFDRRREILNIDACTLRNDTVKTSEGKKVGQVANIIFKADSKNPKAWLLVLPFEENWLKEHLKNNWGGLTIEAIKTMLPEDLPKIQEDIANKGTAAAEKAWQAYIADNAEKFEMRFKMGYFVPVSEIDENKLQEGQITLKCNWERVGDLYRFISEPDQLTDKMLPLFKTINKPVNNLKKLLPVTLNLSPVIFGFDLVDSNEDSGTVAGLQLSLDIDAVSAIVVEASGENPGTYLIPPKDFDFSELCAKKPFGEFAKVED